MNAATSLLRQVHPHFFKNGHVASVAFRPTPIDNGALSVYDGDKIEPQRSWEHYTTTLGHTSAGVWAVTVSEVQQCGLTASEDPIPGFPQHAIIAFGSLSKKDQAAKAKVLAAKAEERGCQFSPNP